jgi:O-antigen ligase
LKDIVESEQPVVEDQSKREAALPLGFFARHGPSDRSLLLLALWSVPVSIAVSESFLSLALLVRIVRLATQRIRVRLPRCFWFWLVWAGMEFAVWTFASEPALGWSEIRHLLLTGTLFLLLPALENTGDRRLIWQGIFLTSCLSSVVLIGDFISRLLQYRREIAAGGDVGLYLRSGGLLHHWMVYGTVEILVIAGLVAFWCVYPEDRRRWWPVAAVNWVAIVLSLTRMAWITCLLLLAIALVWRRSKWILALPLAPLILFVLAPDAVRLRVAQSFSPSYYSNTERTQMLRVGWKMVRDHPLMGVGPGRVDKLYESYLSPEDPVPAYHGHLHNNLAQLAAQFGIPVTLAACLFVVVLFRDLVRAQKAALSRDERFIAQAALLALTGFLFAGLFEYTYGHSLGLILLTFAVSPALIARRSGGDRVAT